MNAVMLSIRPQWCEFIANGRKTIEVRKTRPKMETPFKCYIYCTQGEEKWLVGIIGKHPAEKLNGKVIGEFVCDAILRHCEMANADIAEQQGCIRREEIFKYAGEKEAFGWHISALQIYDKPMELNEFHKPEMPTGLRYEDDTIKRPPQSWAYVEEYDGKH